MKNVENEKIRVRFAPSPTGLLHVGSFRTALFNWLFARKNGGSFILRIEDTDRKRSSEEFLNSQMADMRWMGLDWDEGPDAGGRFAPYNQMGRLDSYKAAAEKLLEAGLVYPCYCTAEELQASRQDNLAGGYPGRCRNLTASEIEAFEKEGRKACLRFRVPDEGETVVSDLIKGEVPFENRLLDDFVIMKSDGIPTYNFAVVVDDFFMKITHVIRGDEHLSNTPRQALLFDALGYPRPVFCHIPIILNEDRTKLSKRKGAVHLLDYKERGYLKEALFNFMALLGWAPKDNREIMNQSELVEAFSLEGIPKHPAVFDEKKLEWMNGQYLNSMPAADIIPLVKEFLVKSGIEAKSKDDLWYEKAVSLYQSRMRTLVEFAENLKCYFVDINGEDFDPKDVKKVFKFDFLPEALEGLGNRIAGGPEFSEEILEEMLRGIADDMEQSAGKIIQAVRLGCTGVTATPPIFDVMVLLGKEELLKRLENTGSFVRKYQEKCSNAL